MKSYTATAPSNIAFLKYWGKQSKSMQWPAGNSLSMTLSGSLSETTVRLIEGSEDQIFFNKSKLPVLDKKILSQLDLIRKQVGSNKHFEVITKNTFPDSCGIASSASGMCALTIATFAALLDANSFTELSAAGYDREKLAHFSRMGSGSACRSMFGGYVSWYKGQTEKDQKIVQEFSKDHLELCDLIFVLSSEKKEISSTEAHDAAWSSPLFAPRLAGLSERHNLLLDAISKRDFTRMGLLIEQDSIEMHSIIMTSKPPINYWHKNTSNFIRWVRTQRELGNFEAYTTIDAGPNVHLICKPKDKEKIIESSKSLFQCEDIIEDMVGTGPTLASKKV